MEHLPNLNLAAHGGRLAHIGFRDPRRRNALDAAALDSLLDAIHATAQSPRCEALLLSGEGSAFCAGFDLAGCAEEPRRVEALLSRLSEAVAALRALDIPVVARVQGAALAGGCALLTGCDFVVVARDAQLGYPVHRIGISPAVSVPSLFSRMGPAARALMMSNELLDGQAALACGLATHCVDEAHLDAEVEMLVARLLSKGPQAMRATKRWIRSIEERMPGDLGATPPRDPAATMRAREASIALASGDEFASMLQAFWSGRAQRKDRPT
jgi:enoyl-CoA hydratase/carnithine racemase